MADTNHSRSTTSVDEGLYTYDSFGQKGKKSESNFLWWCAGAHQQLLKQFPSEHSKYSGLGGVLLATFVLAAISQRLRGIQCIWQLAMDHRSLPSFGG